LVAETAVQDFGRFLARADDNLPVAFVMVEDEFRSIRAEMSGVEYTGLPHFYRALVYLVEKYQAAPARFERQRKTNPPGYHPEED